MAATTPPALVEALIVNEVLDWGETATALRLEYSEEISAKAVEHSNEQPGKITYSLVNDRSIVNVYVNNSGKKDDVQLQGKYVFINLGIKNQDTLTFRDQVTFNDQAKTRDQQMSFYIYQQEEIVTVSGKVIPHKIRIVTTGEITVVVDDFQTFTYTSPANGKTLSYHLYIPAGYKTKSASLANLPLVAHYPAGDFSYIDYTGLYRGALFTHPDAVNWATEEAQAANPAFVVTIGGASDRYWTVAHSASEMQQTYVEIIKKLVKDYNIDPARLYGVSVSGGSVAMWQTILNNPGLFAAQMTSGMDLYQGFGDAAYERGGGTEVPGSEDHRVRSEGNYGRMMDKMPTWFFAGLTDGSGAGILGAEDTRAKGERLRDIAIYMNNKGYNIDIAYGNAGELMWNGLLRGAPAEKQAQAQLDRAAAIGSNHLVTLYIPGTILGTMHWSWNATYSNAVARNWLFQQINVNPVL
jgi:predicted peptidase